MTLQNLKKSQSEIITTVLLVLISITAVVLVSNFVINMVRSNLRGTDCFQTNGQFELKMDEGWTFYNSSEKMIYLSLERGGKDLNISGINLIYGNEFGSQPIKLLAGQINSNISFYNSNGLWDNSNGLRIPRAGESTAYRINISSSLINITQLSIHTILPNGQICDRADQETIPVY